MCAHWIPIKPVGLSEQCPQLFVKYTFHSSGYTVVLTDLSRIFAETIERRELLGRALNENTSIDPTEDAKQFKIFLEKIKSALAGEAGTALLLLKPPTSEEIILRTVSSLPEPLGTLEWPIRLSLEPPERLATELVVPVFASLYNKALQLSELITYIHDKDHVISKLLDRLEQSGTDISTVFPGAAGVKSSKKATLRDQAARHVRGLGPFDAEQWRHNVTDVQPSGEKYGEILQQVRESKDSADIIESKSLSWWKDLKLLSEAGDLTKACTNTHL